MHSPGCYQVYIRHTPFQAPAPRHIPHGYFRAQGIPKADLYRLNQCRLYLQVSRLSDITNIAGKRLYTHILSLHRDLSPTTQPIYPTSKLQWPRQPKPGPKVCRLWAHTLNHTYLHAGGSLRQPLGPWITPADERDHQYPTLYHEYSGVIHK
jgi:hypothetical protein